jgi:hypothetical protein
MGEIDNTFILWEALVKFVQDSSDCGGIHRKPTLQRLSIDAYP